jgi:type III secretion protein T
MSASPGENALWNLFAPMLAAMPRLSAAVSVAPLFPSTLFPVLLRGAIVISLSLCLYPHMAAHMPTSSEPLTWLALISKEAFIGALLGFAVGTLVWVFESVGAMVDFQIGLSNAMIFDPFGGHEAGPLSRFMARTAVILFVAGGGLQVFVSLLFESFRLWPVASFYPVVNARLADFAGTSMGSMVELIVRLAAPVVLLLALIDLGFGLINRVVPQLNVFFFTMPIKGILAALMILIYLSYLADVVASQISGLQDWLTYLQPVLDGR